MLNDFHFHTEFSTDSDAPSASMIERGISLGMDMLCVTDHQDADFPEDNTLWIFDTDDYFQTMNTLKNAYADKIELRIGVELGLQTHLADYHQDYVKKYPFDFIIGSSHVINHMDPYYPEFYEGKTEPDALREYFQNILDNLAVFTDIDVYGHLDYIVRYFPSRKKLPKGAEDPQYSYLLFRDYIDSILEKLISLGIGLELNTAGFKYGLGHPNPHEDIIKRYREMGGEIITVGSDAHKPEHLGYDFDKARDILLECGFQYYTVFKNRKAEFIKIM